MSYNTYGQSETSGRAPIPVWAEVRGVKHGGGSINLADKDDDFFITAGTPVHLDKSGGDLTPLLNYEVTDSVGASDKEFNIRCYVAPKVNDAIMVFPETLDGKGLGSKVTKVEHISFGVYTVTVATALGELSAGDILAKADKVHATDSVLANKNLPSGLLFHDIVKEKGDTWGTGAVVDEGRIFEDRIVGVPALYKSAMPSIKFEKGI